MYSVKLVAIGFVGFVAAFRGQGVGCNDDVTQVEGCEAVGQVKNVTGGECTKL